MWAWLRLKLPRPSADQWEDSIQALDQSEAAACWWCCTLYYAQAGCSGQGRVSRDAVVRIFLETKHRRQERGDRVLTSYIRLTPGAHTPCCHHCQGVREDRIILSRVTLTFEAQHGSWNCQLWRSVWLFPGASKQHCRQSRGWGQGVSPQLGCQLGFSLFT